MSAGSTALTQLKETLASEKTAPPLSLSSLPPRLSRLFVALGNAVHCVAGLRLIVCQFELWHIRGPNPSPPPTEQRRTFKAPAVGSFCCSQSFLTVGSSVSQERHISIGNSFPCKSASMQKKKKKNRHPHPPHHHTHTCTHLVRRLYLGCSFTLGNRQELLLALIRDWEMRSLSESL